MLGTKNLAEILSERETISQVMQSALDEATDPWGVKAERVEMWVAHAFPICQCNFNDLFELCYSKDVRLPVQLQRAMAAEAEAAREARAKVGLNVKSLEFLRLRYFMIYFPGHSGRGRAEGL